MKTEFQESRPSRFVLGLLAGSLVGAGLALWFAPRRGSELRAQVTKAARDFGARATERYDDSVSRVAGVVDDATRKGQKVRDDVADAVARGAHEVERYAKASKAV